ncbi:MAG TPA: hypothetical protein VLA04_06100 [Verrucomicrobiae bacterium]|nr:hypothetical protein [Verrucomicrobiae bacterium]
MQFGRISLALLVCTFLATASFSQTSRAQPFAPAASPGLTVPSDEAAFKKLDETAPKAATADFKAFLTSYGATWTTIEALPDAPTTENPQYRGIVVRSIARVPHLVEGAMIRLTYTNNEGAQVTVYERLEPATTVPKTYRLVVSRGPKWASKINSMELITLKTMKRFTLADHVL